MPNGQHVPPADAAGANGTAEAARRLRWFDNNPNQPTGTTKSIEADDNKISVTAAYYNTYRHG